ncbi:MAG TPA: phosphoribosylamine--glycine ligase [Candidatus Thermoplasmatota archaeon]|nr:phosphoribosylamine--glycine ligase [Candidatus Thermoplasmatota archaeon]
MKKILVVGGGAREHALCDAVHRSQDATLFSVMKNVNPGIKHLAEDYKQIKETDVEQVVTYAKQQGIDMVFIGPEAPLQSGLTNALQKQQIAVCAPTKDAARIETDKEWMRNLLEKHQLPGQLKYQSFTNVKKAKQYIEELQGKVVLKPVGLTGGKGVKVAGDHFTDISGALEYIDKIFEEKIGGSAKVVIEEKAEGEEFTIQGFTDGKNLKTLPAVQDHKRLQPGDKGPNTGGMGSYSTNDGLLPFLTQEEYDAAVHILQEIIIALAKENCAYVGPIYGQFMLTNAGPKVIEINARFGDPEAMNVLPLLQTDFVSLGEAMIHQRLDLFSLDFDMKSTVCKYVVPEGYGIKSLSDKKITIDAEQIKKAGARLFYASVNQDNDDVKTTSSRSLAIVGFADDLSSAEQICEDALQFVHSDHIYIRHDIGKKDLIQQRIDHMTEIRGVKTTI